MKPKTVPVNYNNFPFIVKMIKCCRVLEYKKKGFFQTPFDSVALC